MAIELGEFENGFAVGGEVGEVGGERFVDVGEGGSDVVAAVLCNGEGGQ